MLEYLCEEREEESTREGNSIHDARANTPASLPPWHPAVNLHRLHEPQRVAVARVARDHRRHISSASFLPA